MDTGEGPAPPPSPEPDEEPQAAEPEPEKPLEGLSARDVAVLTLARRTWHRPGARERAIREQLGISPTRYYQLLNALLDNPEALAHDPVTVNRLRRIRDAHRSQH